MQDTTSRECPHESRKRKTNLEKRVIDRGADLKVQCSLKATFSVQEVRS